jgi:outer membrane receptor protein involved in Fe transport
MRSLSPRALLAFGALVAVASACTSGRAKREEAPKPAQQSGSGTVSAKNIQNEPGKSIEEILAGRVSGVRVSRSSDGGIAVQIRGGTSLMGDNAPLYVVDGVPIMPGPGGALIGVSPYDIESIWVLKDAARTSE